MNKLLVLGDVAVLVAFAAGGVSFHEVEGSIVSELLRIVLPFWIGYFAIAWGFEALEVRGSGKDFAWRSSVSWFVGMLCGLFLRGMQRGSPPDLPFVTIALIFTAVCFALWRGLFWWLVRRSAKKTSD